MLQYVEANKLSVRAVTFSFLCPLIEKCGTFIARCNALIEKVSSFSVSHRRWMVNHDRGRGAGSGARAAVLVGPVVMGLQSIFIAPAGQG
eukprot:SAG31_NODE_3909_length_3762_cov_2.740923_6_plen_90_part_00